MLPVDTRIAWLGEMAVMTEAGVAVADAATRVAQGMEEPARRAAGATAKRLANGRALADAAVADGLLDASDAAVVAAGEASGNVPALLRRIAEAEERARTVRATVRSRLLMPALVVVIALFVAPLPDLVAGRIDLGGYLMRSLGTGLIVFAALLLVVRLAGHIRRTGPLVAALADLELRLPWIGAVQRRRNQLGFLDRLGLMFAAGLPLSDAVRGAGDAIRNARMRRDLRDVPALLDSGRSLAEALAQWPWLDGPVHALIATGESAGRLDDTLKRLVQTESVRLDDDDRQVGEWVPRLIYFTVGAWLVSQLLGGAML